MIYEIGTPILIRLRTTATETAQQKSASTRVSNRRTAPGYAAGAQNILEVVVEPHSSCSFHAIWQEHHAK